MRVSKKTQDEILEDVFKIALKRGLTTLTLRSIAKEIDTSARMLVYHFGSFEGLMVQLNRKYSHFQKENARSQIGVASRAGNLMRDQFDILRDPKNQNLFLLFSDLHAQAMRSPSKSEVFVQSSYEEWLDLIFQIFKEKGFNRRQSDALGTILLSAQRGLMADLICHKRTEPALTRVQDAIELLAVLLNEHLDTIQKAMNQNSKPLVSKKYRRKPV